jgi:hypothetical protein
VVVMNVAIIWGIASCSPYVNRHFGGKYHLHLHGRKSAEQETSKLQVAGHIFVFSPTSKHILHTVTTPICMRILKGWLWPPVNIGINVNKEPSHLYSKSKAIPVTGRGGQ